MLLIVALQKKILFKFAGPILENLFLRTNMLELEHLAVRDKSFRVYKVATVHVKMLVSVCGFNVQVSPDPAIFQVDNPLKFLIYVKIHAQCARLP